MWFLRELLTTCKFNLRCNPPGNRSAGKFGMQEPGVCVLGGGGGLPACSLLPIPSRMLKNETELVHGQICRLGGKVFPCGVSDV